MELIFTTTNKYKINSASLVLKKYDINIIGYDVAVPEIQADTVEEIILDKVAKCYKIVGKPLVAMDSGIFIEALNGFPGPYTKYVISSIGEDGLINLVKPLTNKNCFVQRTIGYTDGIKTKIFISRGYGEIIEDKRGKNGLNYDLVFYVPTLKKTLAELSDEEKVKVWGSAWDDLGKWIVSEKDE